MIRLDIISDVACPWCYVGKGYLYRALEARPDHPFRIEWHPYQLDPTIPPGGLDRTEYMTARFGSAETVAQMHEPLLAHAAKAGVAFDLDAIGRAPNTLDAHRLIHWAGLEGRQSAMVSALFRAYWQGGRDIGDPVTLTAIAAEVGMDRTATARLLASDADLDTVRARISHSQSRGVRSVPTYIIADRHAVQGAQPMDLWLSVIDDLIAQSRQASARKADQ